MWRVKLRRPRRQRQRVYGWTGFADAFRDGYVRVPVLRLIRRRKTHGRLEGSLARWLGVSCLPLGVAVVVDLVTRSVPSAAWSYLLVLALVTAGSIGAAFTAWGIVAREANEVDGVCRTHNGACVARPLHFLYWLPLQVSVVGVGAVACGGAILEAHRVASLGTVGTTLVAFAAAICGAVVFGDLYWILATPLLAFSLSQCPEVELRWNDPAQTPGVRTLAKGYVVAGLLTAALAAGVTLPQIWGHNPFGDALPGVYLTVLATSLWVGAAPLLVLATSVHRQKMRSLDALALEWSQRTDQPALDEVEMYASAYSAVSSASLLPVGVITGLPFVAFIATSVVGYFQK